MKIKFGALILILNGAFAGFRAEASVENPETKISSSSWTFQALREAAKKSGRRFTVTQGGFDNIQERKAAARKKIEDYLTEKFKKADERVLTAFDEVPREYFHYHYALKYEFAVNSYEEEAKPWAIGYGSALSDYLGQAYMTQLAHPKKTDVVLEIGTGSGYQISLLSRMVKKAYSIEIIEPLGTAVAKIFQPLHYANIETKVGDGFFGWPEVKGGFDIIMFTCAAQYVPPPLFDQLKVGGRLIVPIGQPFKRGQQLYVYRKDKEGKIHSRKDVGVFFIPMTGEAGKNLPSAEGNEVPATPKAP